MKNLKNLAFVKKKGVPKILMENTQTSRSKVRIRHVVHPSEKENDEEIEEMILPNTSSAIVQDSQGEQYYSAKEIKGFPKKESLLDVAGIYQGGKFSLSSNILKSFREWDGSTRTQVKSSCICPFSKNSVNDKVLVRLPVITHRLKESCNDSTITNEGNIVEVGHQFERGIRNSQRCPAVRRIELSSVGFFENTKSTIIILPSTHYKTIDNTFLKLLPKDKVGKIDSLLRNNEKNNEASSNMDKGFSDNAIQRRNISDQTVLRENSSTSAEVRGLQENELITHALEIIASDDDEKNILDPTPDEVVTNEKSSVFEQKGPIQSWPIQNEGMPVFSHSSKRKGDKILKRAFSDYKTFIGKQKASNGGVMECSKTESFYEIPLHNLISTIAEQKREEYILRSAMNWRVYEDTEMILENVKILDFSKSMEPREELTKPIHEKIAEKALSANVVELIPSTDKNLEILSQLPTIDRERHYKKEDRNDSKTTNELTLEGAKTADEHSKHILSSLEDLKLRPRNLNMKEPNPKDSSTSDLEIPPNKPKTFRKRSSDEAKKKHDDILGSKLNRYENYKPSDTEKQIFTGKNTTIRREICQGFEPKNDNDIFSHKDNIASKSSNGSRSDDHSIKNILLKKSFAANTQNLNSQIVNKDKKNVRPKDIISVRSQNDNSGSIKNDNISRKNISGKSHIPRFVTRYIDTIKRNEAKELNEAIHIKPNALSQKQFKVPENKNEVQRAPNQPKSTEEFINKSRPNLQQSLKMGQKFLNLKEDEDEADTKKEYSEKNFGSSQAVFLEKMIEKPQKKKMRERKISMENARIRKSGDSKKESEDYLIKKTLVDSTEMNGSAKTDGVSCETIMERKNIPKSELNRTATQDLRKKVDHNNVARNEKRKIVRKREETRGIDKVETSKSVVRISELTDVSLTLKHGENDHVRDERNRMGEGIEKWQEEFLPIDKILAMSSTLENKQSDSKHQVERGNGTASKEDNDKTQIFGADATFNKSTNNTEKNVIPISSGDRMSENILANKDVKNGNEEVICNNDIIRLKKKDNYSQYQNETRVAEKSIETEMKSKDASVEVIRNRNPKKVKEFKITHDSPLSRSLSENVIVLKAAKKDSCETIDSEEGITESFLQRLKDRLLNSLRLVSKSKKYTTSKSFKDLSIVLKKSQELLMRQVSSLTKIYQNAKAEDETIRRQKLEMNETYSIHRDSNGKVNDDCKQGGSKSKSQQNIFKSAPETRVTSKKISPTQISDNPMNVLEHQNEHRRNEVSIRLEEATPPYSISNVETRSIGSIFADTVTSALAKCQKEDKILNKYTDSIDNFRTGTATDDEFEQIMKIAHDVKDKMMHVDLAIENSTRKATDVSHSQFFLNDNSPCKLSLKVKLSEKNDFGSDDEWNCDLVAVLKKTNLHQLSGSAQKFQGDLEINNSIEKKSATSAKFSPEKIKRGSTCSLHSNKKGHNTMSSSYSQFTEQEEVYASKDQSLKGVSEIDYPHPRKKKGMSYQSDSIQRIPGIKPVSESSVHEEERTFAEDCEYGVLSEKCVVDNVHIAPNCDSIKCGTALSVEDIYHESSGISNTTSNSGNNLKIDSLKNSYTDILSSENSVIQAELRADNSKEKHNNTIEDNSSASISSVNNSEIFADREKTKNVNIVLNHGSKKAEEIPSIKIISPDENRPNALPINKNDSESKSMENSSFEKRLSKVQRIPNESKNDHANEIQHRLLKDVLNLKVHEHSLVTNGSTLPPPNYIVNFFETTIQSDLTIQEIPPSTMIRSEQELVSSFHTGDNETDDFPCPLKLKNQNSSDIFLTPETSDTNIKKEIDSNYLEEVEDFGIIDNISTFEMCNRSSEEFHFTEAGCGAKKESNIVECHENDKTQHCESKLCPDSKICLDRKISPTSISHGETLEDKIERKIEQIDFEYKLTECDQNTISERNPMKKPHKQSSLFSKKDFSEVFVDFERMGNSIISFKKNEQADSCPLNNSRTSFLRGNSYCSRSKSIHSSSIVFKDSEDQEKTKKNDHEADNGEMLKIPTNSKRNGSSIYRDFVLDSEKARGISKELFSSDRIESTDEIERISRSNETKEKFIDGNHNFSVGKKQDQKLIPFADIRQKLDRSDIFSGATMTGKELDDSHDEMMNISEVDNNEDSVLGLKAYENIEGKNIKSFRSSNTFLIPESEKKDKSLVSCKKHKILEKFNRIISQEDSPLLNIRQDMKFDRSTKTICPRETPVHRVDKRSPKKKSETQKPKMILTITPSEELYIPPSKKKDNELEQNLLKNPRKFIELASKRMKKNEFLKFLFDLKTKREVRKESWRKIIGGASSPLNQDGSKRNSLEEIKISTRAIKNTFKEGMARIKKEFNDVCDRAESYGPEKGPSKTLEENLKATKKNCRKDLKQKQILKKSNEYDNQSKRNLSSTNKEASVLSKEQSLPFTLMRYLENSELPVISEKSQNHIFNNAMDSDIKRIKNDDSNKLRRTLGKSENYTQMKQDDKESNVDGDLGWNMRIVQKSEMEKLEFKEANLEEPLEKLLPKELDHKNAPKSSLTMIHNSKINKLIYEEQEEANDKEKVKPKERAMDFLSETEKTENEKQILNMSTGSVSSSQQEFVKDSLSCKGTELTETNVHMKTAIVPPGREPLEISLIYPKYPNKPTENSEKIDAENPLDNLSEVLSNCSGPISDSFLKSEKKTNNGSKSKSNKSIPSSIKSQKEASIRNSNIQQMSLRKYENPLKKLIWKNDNSEKKDEQLPSSRTNKNTDHFTSSLNEIYSRKIKVIKTKSLSEMIKEDPYLLKRLRQRNMMLPSLPQISEESDPPRKFEYRFHDFRRREDKSFEFKEKHSLQRKKDLLEKFKDIIQARKIAAERSRYVQTKDGAEQISPKIFSRILDRVNYFTGSECVKREYSNSSENFEGSNGRCITNIPSSAKKRKNKPNTGNKKIHPRTRNIDEDLLNTLVQAYPETAEQPRTFLNLNDNKEQPNVIHIPWSAHGKK